MIDSQIEYILNDIRTITENVVIKLTDEAERHETVDSKRNGERYVNAVLERDTFEAHPWYEREVLMKAGINDVEEIERCYYDKYNIPRIKRDLVLKYKRELIINEFYETNDYYRTLIGLPPMDEEDDAYAYLTQEEMDFYNIDEARPIFEYPVEIQIKLERSIIPRMIEEHPEKPFLKYLGSKKIDLVRAREAKNFEIIFIDTIIDNIFLRNFVDTYAFCREYFMSVIYNKHLRDRYDLYENFMGMSIMIMTVQRMIVNTIKLSIDRDFYDLNSIKKMFDCYGVPFFEDLPLDYQRAMVKNLNILIRRKSTDRCLCDITEILMYERVRIYKYLLVKERYLDKKTGEPLYFEKESYDDEGNVTMVPDFDKMYDVYFQSADILEPNIALAIESKPNRHEYLEVTEGDVLWWDTDDLRKELFDREFNYIETKYIGINIMYNLTDLLYETVYFLNLLVDNKDTTDPFRSTVFNSDTMKTGTDYLYIVLNRLSPIPISIFDTVVVLCALVSKKNGMKGNIIHSSAGKILSVLGFNFEADFDLIKENIKKYPRIFKDQSILQYLDLLDIKKVEDIEVLYHNFRNFADFCIDRMAETEDINEYKAYKLLYKVFTVREETGEAFRMPNGKIADTYLEYLYAVVPHIAEKIDAMHKDKMGVIIEHVIGKLNELVPDIEYLSSLNGTNNNIVKALIAMIKFFKSYTVDLRNLNVVYIYADKGNMIRMIDDPRLFNRLYPRETFIEYNDSITDTSINYDLNDKLKFEFFLKMFITLYINDKINYKELHYIVNKFMCTETIDMIYADMITDITTNFHKTQKIVLDEKPRFFIQYYGSEIYEIKDTGKVVNVTEEISVIGLFDGINESSVNMDMTHDIQKIKDKWFIQYLYNEKDNIILEHKPKFNKIMNSYLTFGLFDDSHLNKSEIGEKDYALQLKDKVKIIYED